MVLAIFMALALTGASAAPRATAQNYPSCDLRAQRAVTGDIGGRIHTPLQAHVSMRANVIQADLSTARKARLLTEARAMALFRQVEGIRRDAARRSHDRVAYRTAFDHRLDALARQFCRV